MERLVANIAGTVRRETFDGRAYIVAPMTMIQPGVLTANKGRLAYFLEDLQASYTAWNGMPIVVNHPVDSSGNSISARDPKVLEQYGIGTVFNTSVNGKLAAEGWFDVEKTRKVNPSVLNALERGDKAELSTGLGVGIDEKPGVLNGQEYDGVARNHRPDHLAVLTDAKGACSLQNGCGVNNKDGDSKQTGLLQKLVDLITGNQSQSHESITQLETNMSKLTDDQRKVIVDNLITNCSCTYKETDRDALNKLEDKVLTSLNTGYESNKKLKEAEDKVKATEVLNAAARKGLQVGNDTMTLNEKGEWVRIPAKQEEVVVNTDKTKPIELKDLPADLQEDITFARNAKQERKNTLIERLVVNQADAAAKVARRVALNKLSLAELEDRVADLPPESTSAASEGGSYFGAPVANTHKVDNANKPTPLGRGPNWDHYNQPLTKVPAPQTV